MAESLRFSQGDKQQETTHLHFQRPALSASPPPRRPRSEALPSGTIKGGYPKREAPIRFPRAQPPPFNTHLQPAGLGWRLCPWCPSEGTQALRGPLTQSGDKRGDPPLRLGYQRTTGGGRGGSPEAEWAVKGGLGSLLALGYLAPVPRHNSRHWSQGEASCPPGPWSPGLQRRSGSSTLLQRLALPCPAGPRLHSRPPLREPLAAPEAGVGGGGERVVGRMSAGTVMRDAPEA